MKNSASAQVCLFVLFFVISFGAVNWYGTKPESVAVSIFMTGGSSWCDYGWPSPWLTVQRDHFGHAVHLTIKSWPDFWESVGLCAAPAVVATVLVSALILELPKSQLRESA